MSEPRDPESVPRDRPSAPRGPEPVANPFSTRHVRPGAIPFRFPPGRSAEGLLERLARNNWVGQVVGPHGSGKSALVATLIDLIERAGRQPYLIELHDGQRRLPVSRRRRSAFGPGTVLVVDGYEQLGAWSRFALRRLRRRRGVGLVVTSHQSVGLPDLFRTTASLALARQIVHDLLGGGPSPVAAHEVDRPFTSHEGNMREILFDLYDLYEQRRQC